MRLKLTTCLLVLALSACKGAKGDKGDTGTQSVLGPGQIEVLTGAVTSDNFLVTDAQIASAQQISVYIKGGGDMSELPYFLPSDGVNTYYIAQPLNSRIQIVNASLAGATSYTIVLIL